MATRIEPQRTTGKAGGRRRDGQERGGRPSRRRSRREYWLRRGIVLGGVLLTVWFVAFAIDGFLTRGRIGRGVEVHTVAVGGLTRDQAREKLQGDTAALAAQGLVVHAGDVRLDLVPTDLGVQIDVDAAVDAAFDARSAWNPVSWLAGLFGTTQVDFPEIAVDAAAVEATLRPHFTSIEVPARDATWETDGERATVVPSEDGFGLDIDQAIREIRRATVASGDSRRAEVPLATIRPDLTTEKAEAMGIEENVGTFTTNFAAGQSRVKNIERISELVNGTVIAPGERLSLNGRIGERTADKGFVEGGVIESGRYETDVGGGVSQYATTLFNAAFFAGIPIPDFKSHSFYISRYPLGREATLAWPDVDLVIGNDYGSYLLVRSEVGASSVTVSLYGTKDGRTVSTETGERTNPTDPHVQCELDSELSPGAEKVTQTAAEGFSVEISRVVTFPDGREVPWTFTTTYRPKDKIIAYSPAEPAPAATAPAPEAAEAPPPEGQAPAPESTTTTTAAPPPPAMACPAADGSPVS